MTRLKTEWVEPMLTGMKEYNRILKRKTGMDLSGLMEYTFGISEEETEKYRNTTKVGVVPITQGEGIISCFSESIAAIVQSMGFDAEVMTHTDVDGIYEGYLKNCDVLFMADDDRYIAVNTNRHTVADNNYGTALGYVKILQAMKVLEKDNLKKIRCPILVIGYGLVGKEAVKILEEMNEDFFVYDKNSEVAAEAGKPVPEGAQIADFKYILDFTNEGDWLSADMLAEDACYSSPGVPCSLTEDARELLGDRAVYDNLEIGTAIMLGQALSE